MVSLATALALPLETDAGVPFPGRDLILFLTFCVILATLVGQGLTLPPLIRRLGIVADDLGEREEVLARREAALGALARLDELIGISWVPAETAEEMRTRYEHRLDQDTDHRDAPARLRQELVEAERRAVVELRNRGEISDEALRSVEYDLDLVEVRVDGGRNR